MTAQVLLPEHLEKAVLLVQQHGRAVHLLQLAVIQHHDAASKVSEWT